MASARARDNDHNAALIGLWTVANDFGEPFQAIRGTSPCDCHHIARHTGYQTAMGARNLSTPLLVH